MKELVNFIWLICFAFLVSLSVANFTYQSEHINDEKNQQLKNFIIEIKQDEKFNSIFQQKLSEFAEDGKITNSEFDELEDLYEQYKTSKIINDTTFADREQQKINEMKKLKENQYSLRMPSFTTLLIVMLSPLLLIIVIRSFGR